MAKIVYDYEKITPILSDLSSTIGKLNSISSVARSLDIPSFGYSSYLRSLSTTLKSDASSLDYIIQNVKNLNSQFERCLNENEKDARKLPNYEMKKRESIIK